MSQVSPFPERLQKAFEPTPRGVVGLVDDLLGLCREQGLQFRLQESRCFVHPLGVEAAGLADVPIQKSVFRAMLARVAALCNERLPNSVSPYGGQGELSTEAAPSTVFQVAFTNTPGEQRLEVRPVGNDRDGVRKFTVLLSDSRVITVYGHALTYVPNTSNPGDFGSYGVLWQTGEAERLVALFRVSAVTGIFSGDLQGS
jgi:hypothetical protein